MEYRLLNRIRSSADLRAMPESEMAPLCREIRSFLIESVERTGGHLASNLGVVELTLALHRTFDPEKNHLIFDVGHQCYVHKLLTGRADRFDTLRTIGGLSGFPKRQESVCDPFGTGHSSTSLSAALGFAEADHIRGSDAYTVAVIGDGAFTGGMIHEALNNVKRDRRLILILNENEMSISRNIGTFAEHIARIRSSERYYRTKNRTATFISRLPLIGGALFRAIRFVKQSLKNQIYGSNLFEELGLYYLGPVDGHDYERICLLLREAVAYGKSAVIHLHTKKGKGYPPAEEKPALYHSIAPATSKTSGDQRRFSAAVGELLCHMAEKDERLCAITAAMGDATGLETFGSRFPERYFDVGIAEEHALTFCAGLSAAGMHPVFAVYSSFLQRGYDNLIHDLALQSLPLTLCIDRAGLSGGDGPTHHGIFDVAFLSQIPDVTIVEPLTFEGLSVALEESREAKGIYAIRYPNGGEMSYPSLSRTGNDPLSPRCSYSPGESIARVIVTYGRLGTEALCARERLGDDCGVILLQRIAPYADAARELLSLLPPTAKTVLIAEEGIRVGGAAMCLRDALCELDTGDHDIRVLAVSDPFHPDAEGGSLYRSYRIDADAMVASMTQK